MHATHLGVKDAPLRAAVASTSRVSSSVAKLAEFRAGWYACLTARADALFELTDAVLSAPTITSLPYLSLEPVFRRSWGSLYDALARGVIDGERVRELLVAAGPAEWPLTFAIDASTHPRPYAETSPGRQWHHLSGPGGVDGGVPGWAWQHVTQLILDHDSWVAPMDVVRVPTGGPAQTLAAVEQIRAMAGRLRAAGRTGRALDPLPAPAVGDLPGRAIGRRVRAGAADRTAPHGRPPGDRRSCLQQASPSAILPRGEAKTSLIPGWEIHALASPF